MRRSIILAAFVGSLWIGACDEDEASTGIPLPSSSNASGPGGGSTGGAGGGTTSECQAYGQAVCDKLDECFPTYVRVAYGDKSRCAYRQGLLCGLQAAAPGSALSPEVASACAQGYAGVSCGSFLAGVATACPYVPGTIADGAECISSWQCASTYCQVTQPDGCGVCMPRVPVNGDCTADGGACEPGTGCANMVCTPYSAETATCAGGEPCDLFLACVNGACSFGSGPDAACDMANPCDFWDQGLFCSMAGQCNPAGLAGSGEACGDVMGVFTACSAGGKCTMGMTCVPPAEDDSACGGPSDIGCYEPRRCIQGSCKDPDTAACGMGGAGGA